jgi:hypothetical protein
MNQTHLPQPLFESAAHPGKGLRHPAERPGHAS